MPSSFIISSFGFPSRIPSKETCLVELKSVEKMLTDDGLFFTIGWDETFNDELNYAWYSYIENHGAPDFESYRKLRMNPISSARNCNPTWLKKHINVPLRFNNKLQAAKVMSHLFGRCAFEDIAQSKKTDWTMSLGITMDTKKSLQKAIQSMEANI